MFSQGRCKFTLPVPNSQIVRCTQSNNTGSHTGCGTNAFDFISDDRIVVAAQSGIVKDLKEDSNIGGNNSSFARHANYVIIDHLDGTEGLYLHLAYNSVDVNPGDYVSTGQRLGIMGATGWSTGVHLHFQIQPSTAISCSSTLTWYKESLPISFLDVEDNNGIPSVGNYTSGNSLEIGNRIPIFGGSVNNPSVIKLTFAFPHNNFSLENLTLGSLMIPTFHAGLKHETNGLHSIQVDLSSFGNLIPSKFDNCEQYDININIQSNNSGRTFKIIGKNQLYFLDENCAIFDGTKNTTSLSQSKHYLTKYLIAAMRLGIMDGQEDEESFLGDLRATTLVKKGKLAEYLYKTSKILGRINEIDANIVDGMYQGMSTCDDFFPFVQTLRNNHIPLTNGGDYFDGNSNISYGELCYWIDVSLNISDNCSNMNVCNLEKDFTCQSSIDTKFLQSLNKLENTFISFDNGFKEPISSISRFTQFGVTAPKPDCNDLVTTGDAVALILRALIYDFLRNQNSSRLRNIETILGFNKYLESNNSRNNNFDVSNWNVIGTYPRLPKEDINQNNIQAPAKKYYYLKDNQPWTSGEGSLIDGNGNEVVYYWSIDGGNLESLKPNNNQVRWTPPKVNETTTFELHIWIGNEVGDFAEGIFYFVVEPSGTNSNFSVSTNNVNHPKERSEEFFYVYADTDWRITETSSWFSVFPAIGSGNEQIQVTAIQHNSATPRTGTMTVTSGGITETITVTQAGVDAILEISNNNFTFAASADEQLISITRSNINWTVTENIPWLSVSRTSGGGTGFFDLICEENNSDNSRGGTVKISGGGIILDIDVFQGNRIGEDIFLTNPYVNQSVIEPNDRFTAYATQNYAGISDEFVRPELYYYLSDDPFFNSADILLGDDDSNLNTGDRYDEERDVLRIPDNTPNGIYYIVYVADAEEDVIEENENNNVAAVEIRVGLPLACVTLSSPTNNATNVNIDANLQWGTVTNAIGYRLSVGTTSGGNEILNDLDVGNVTTYNLPNDLPYSSTIYVLVTAYDNVSETSSCTEQSFTTESQPICNTPTNLTTANITQNAVEFNWSSVDNGISYDVQYRIQGVNTWTSAGTGNTAYNSSNLNANTTYEWRIRANCGNIFSIHSSIQTFTTLSDNTADCPNDINHEKTHTTGSSNFRAKNVIVAKDIVRPNVSVAYYAGNSITFPPGTHFEDGSSILAKIEDCPNTFVPKSTSRNTVSDSQRTEIVRIADIEKEVIQLKTFPNPFQSQTTIKYHLPKSSTTNLQLVDFLGRKVSTLTNNQQKAKGWHELQLNAADLQTGTYFLVLRTNNQIKSQKIILLK